MSFISYNKCLGLVILLVLFTVKQTTGYRHSSLSIIGTLAEIRHQSGCPTEPLLLLEQELGGSMAGSAGPQGAPHSPLPYGLACPSSLSGGILAAMVYQGQGASDTHPLMTQGINEPCYFSGTPSLPCVFPVKRSLLIVDEPMHAGRQVCVHLSADWSLLHRQKSL